MGTSESELIARVVSLNDSHAFAYLVRLYQSQIRNLFRRMTNGDDALADDLAQETFLKVYRGIARFQGRSKFSTWIYQIAVNCFKEYLRKNNKNSLELLLGDSIVDEPQPVHAGELRHDLDVLLAPLNGLQKMCILLNIGHEHSHSEIATMLDLPIGTVKTHILRGMKLVRSKPNIEVYDER